MIRQLSRNALLALVLGIIVSACGGNPNKPDPTCTDPKATNVGSPLPCTFPAPTVSSISLQGTKPVSGSTLKMTIVVDNGNGTWSVSGGDDLFVTLKYEVADGMVAQADEDLYIVWCLSQDGVKHLTVSPKCMARPVTKRSGEEEFRTRMDPLFNVIRTDYIMMGMYKIKKSELQDSAKYILTAPVRNVAQVTFHFVPSN